MVYLWVVLLSILSACLYRMGGCGPTDLIKEWGWVPAPIRNFPKKRDVGSNLCTLGAAYLVGVTGPWWAWILAFGLLWASLSTYWDWMFKEDNFFMHGFMCCFSMLPLAFYGDPAKALAIRCLVGGLVIGLWSQFNTNATKEELGRGFLLPFTLLLCLWV